MHIALFLDTAIFSKEILAVLVNNLMAVFFLPKGLKNFKIAFKGYFLYRLREYGIMRFRKPLSIG